MTDKQLKELAIDFRAGRIFTDRHIQNKTSVSSVFMVLALLNGKQIEDLQADPPGMIYEYMTEACPMSVNGMPTFFSMRSISKEDVKRLDEYIDRLEEAEKTV